MTTTLKPVLEYPPGAGLPLEGSFPIMAGYTVVNPTVVNTTNFPSGVNSIEGTMQFSATPADLSTGLSRLVWIEAEIEMTITHSFNGDNTGNQARMPDSQGCMWSEADALRPFPLTVQACNSMSVQFNTGAITQINNDVVPAMMRCGNTTEMWRGCSGAPTQQDMCGDYRMGVVPITGASDNNTLAGPSTNSNLAITSRDPWKGRQAVLNANTFCQSHFTARQGVRNPDAGPSRSCTEILDVQYSKSVPTAASNNVAKVRFITREPLQIAPLSPQLDGEKWCIRGVNQFAVTMQITNAQRMHCHSTQEYQNIGTPEAVAAANPAVAPVGDLEGMTRSTMVAANYLDHDSYPPVGFQAYTIPSGANPAAIAEVTYNFRFMGAPRLLVKWYNFSVQLDPSKELFYPYYNVQAYTNNGNPTNILNKVAFRNGGVLAPTVKASQKITSNAIIFQTVPKRIIICCLPAGPRGADVVVNGSKAITFNSNAHGQAEISDHAGFISAVSITFNNEPGLLSAATPYQLFELSLQNGYTGTWEDWQGIGGVGSWLILDVGKDIGMRSPDEPPGTASQRNFMIDVTVGNLNPLSTEQYSLNIFTVQPGILTIKNATLEQNYTPVLPAAVRAAYASSETMPAGAPAPLYGGDLFAKKRLGTFAKKYGQTLLSSKTNGFKRIGYGRGYSEEATGGAQIDKETLRKRAYEDEDN